MPAHKRTGSALKFIGILLLSTLTIGTACDNSSLRTGRPLIQLTPESIAFGAYNVGDVGVQSLTILNNGSATLEIQGLQIENDGGSQVFSVASLDGVDFGAGSLPRQVAQLGASGPGHCQVDLRFSPLERRSYEAWLVIDSNADNEPQIRVPLSGSGAVPDIEVRPGTLAFGGVGLNSSASLSLTIANRGEAALLVPMADLALESGADASPFFWIGQDLNLAAGQEDSVEVLYAPKTYDLDNQGQVIPDSDTLLIHSNDPDEDPVSVTLSGYVSDNLAPVTAVKIVSVAKLDGTLLGDVCAAAPVDTIRFEGAALDPDGSPIQGGNLRWRLEGKPGGSTRSLSIPSQEDQKFWPTFKADLAGEYVVCLAASDPEGHLGEYDPDAACSCEEANAATDYSCPCIRFTAFPREDIRVELTWDILGPDLDLHLVAPAGEYCSPTRDCRGNDTAIACVESDTMTLCRVPNCDPVAAGCAAGQECYDPDDAGPEPPGCHWQTCSGSDCYWNARKPDWGVPGDDSDDPIHAIDCTGGCRAENINLNNPEPGYYNVMVNYWEYAGNTTATVRIYFKGDQVPTAEFSKEMSAVCERWNVALIEWIDHNEHPVIYLDGATSEACCD